MSSTPRRGGVDQYVARLKRTRTDRDMSSQGLSLARMYLEGRDLESAKKHLQSYLACNNRDHLAHKLMGNIYKQMGDSRNALHHYEKSLEQKTQRDLLVKVAQLYCEQPASSLTLLRVERLLKQLSSVHSSHPVILDLQERCFRMSGGGDQAAVCAYEQYIVSSLASRPCDAQLHMRLVRLLLDCDQLAKAVVQCMEVSLKDVIPMTGDWLQLVCEVSELAMEKGVRGNGLLGLSPLAVCTFWIWVLERNVVNAIRTSVGDLEQILSTLASFDQALHKCWSDMELHSAVLTSTESKSLWTAVLKEMRGRLYEHCASVLIVQGIQRCVAWSLVRKHFLACCLASIGECPCDRQLFESTTHTLLSGEHWHAMGCRRHCRIGHCLQSLTRQLGDELIGDIIVDVIFVEGQQSLIRTVFRGKSSKICSSQSFLCSDKLFLETKMRIVDDNDLAVFEQMTILSKPHDLHQLAWIGSNRLVQEIDVLPDVGSWCPVLFSKLPLFTRHLAQCSWDCVTVHDVEAFLYGLFIGSAAVVKNNRAVSHSVEAPLLLPMAVTSSLPTVQSLQWWNALLKLNSLAPSDVADMSQSVKLTMQSGLEALRGVRLHSIGATLLVQLARLFSAKASELRSDDEDLCADVCEALEQRAARYWQAGYDGLRLLESGFADVEASQSMFHCAPSPAEEDEVQDLLLECKLELAAVSVRDHNFQNAIELYSQIETSEAAWNQAQILKFLARPHNESEDGIVETEKPAVHTLLKEAEQLLNICQSRFTGEENIEFRAAVQADLETVQAQITEHIDTAVSYQLDEDAEIDSVDEDVMSLSKSRVDELSTQVSEMASELREKDESISMLTEELQALKHEVKAMKATSSGNSSQFAWQLSTGKPPPPPGFAARMPLQGNVMSVRPSPDGYSRAQPPMMHMLRQQLSETSSGRGSVDLVQPTPWLPTSTADETSLTQQQSLPQAASMGELTRNNLFSSQCPPQHVSSDRSSELQQSHHDSHPPGSLGSSLSFLQRSNSATVHKTSTPMTAEKTQEESSSLIASPFTPTPAVKLFASSRDGNTSAESDQTVVGRSATIPWSSMVSGMSEASQMKSDIHQGGKPEGLLLSTDLSSEQETSGKAFGSSSLRNVSDFSSLAASSQSGFHFGGSNSKFVFEGTGAGIFQDKTNESDDEGALNESEDRSVDDGPQFKPLVSLPEPVEVKTGEEEEMALFAHRAKLYRYDKGVAQWKERGTGDIKILKNNETNKCRVVMRREQVLKLCANHYITANMELKPHAGSDRAWVWSTAADFTDGEPKVEQLAVKFRDPSTAASFKDVFNECKEQTANTHEDSEQNSGNSSRENLAIEREKAPASLSDLIQSQPGAWECTSCWVKNEATRSKCVACSTPIPSFQPGVTLQQQVSGQATIQSSETREEPQAPLFTKFQPLPGSWSCDVCLLTNKSDVTSCIACQSLRPGAATDSQHALKPTASQMEGSAIRPLVGPSTTATTEDKKALVSGFKIGSLSLFPSLQPGAVNKSNATDTTAASATVSTSAIRFGLMDSRFSSIANSEPKPMFSFSGGGPVGAAGSKNLPRNGMASSSAPAATLSHGLVATAFQPSVTPQVMAAVSTSVTEDLEMSDDYQFDDGDEESDEDWTDDVESEDDKGTADVESVDDGRRMAEPTATTTEELDEDEVVFLFERHPTADQLMKAEKYQLPPTFYLYEDRQTPPWCRSEQDDSNEGPPEAELHDTVNDKQTLDEVPHSDVGRAEDTMAENGPTSQHATFGFDMTSMPTFSQLAASATSRFTFIKPLSEAPFSFGGTGLPLFASERQEEHDELVPEEEADISFDPVVQLPAIVPVMTGEEGLKEVFCSRAKLFRFDKDLGQWKERGVGDIKLFLDPKNDKTRLLMRREQVLKVCANHYITEDMELNPHPSSDRSWVWLTPADFSEGEARPENLAVRFRTTETAGEFKEAFDKFKGGKCHSAISGVDDADSKGDTDDDQEQLSSDRMTAITDSNNHSIGGHSLNDDDVVFVWERKPTADQIARALKFQLPSTFYLYEDRPSPPWCHHDSDDEDQDDGSTKLVDKATDASSETETKKSETAASLCVQISHDDHHKDKNGVSETAIFGSSRHTTDSFADLAARTSSMGSVFQFGASDDPTFKGAGSLVFGGGSRVNNGHDTEEVVNNEDIHVEPIVSLPDYVDVKTGEEDEQIVFCERAKLYRLDRQSGLWKDRGVGDMKLLFNTEMRRGRVVMRREQVLKVCANHYIIPQMELKSNAGSDRSWVWVAPADPSEGEATTEQLAVRFKTPEQAQLFKEKFDQLRQGHAGSDFIDSQAVDTVSEVGQTAQKTCDPIISAVLEEVASDSPSASNEGQGISSGSTDLMQSIDKVTSHDDLEHAA